MSKQRTERQLYRQAVITGLTEALKYASKNYNVELRIDKSVIDYYTDEYICFPESENIDKYLKKDEMIACTWKTQLTAVKSFISIIDPLKKVLESDLDPEPGIIKINVIVDKNKVRIHRNV